MSGPILQPTPLINFIKDALEAGGFSPANSEIVAAHLVDAEMKGVPSHGINRLGLYLGEAQRHVIDPKAEPIVDKIKSRSKYAVAVAPVMQRGASLSRGDLGARSQIFGTTTEYLKTTKNELIQSALYSFFTSAGGG